MRTSGHPMGAGAGNGRVRAVSDTQTSTAEPLGLGDRAQWRGVLRTPYRSLFYANVTSSLGDWIGVTAILALTEQILGGATRGTAFALAGVIIARIVPTMLLGPVAGVYVDRWDRRRVMIWTDIGRGLVMALVPFSPDIYALLLATLVIEVMSTLFLPAKDAVIPQLVPRGQLVAANQLNLAAAYGTFPLGGAIFALFAGASASLLGDQWEFLAARPAAVPIWLNSLTFFISAVFVARISGLGSQERERVTTAAARSETLGAWEELKAGFRFITGHALVRGLVTGIMGAFLAAGAVVSGGQLFATIVNAGDIGFGILIAVVGTGLFLGILSVGPLSRRLAKEQLFAPGIATAGVALIVTALMPRLDLASIPVFVMGYGGGLAFLSAYTILQERTDDDLRGRTFAAFNTGIRAALFASLVVVPLLIAAIGPEAQGLVAEGQQPVGDGAVQPGEVDGPIAYNIGGVRISLMLAGLIALGGAIYSGRSIHRILSADEDHDQEPLHFRGEGMPRPAGGLFVAFEGGDGAGKSTQIALLCDVVEDAGYTTTVTREPGGTAIGERLREIVLDPSLEAMSDRAEALLYAAARAQHVDEVIRPALERGDVLLTDRYVDSSIVYQGIGRDLGEDPVAELNRWATAALVPDLVVVLDVAPEEGLRRVGAQVDRLEGAGVDFHRQVNTAFRSRATADPDRYLVLDAARSEGELHAEIRRAVLDRLGADGHPGPKADTGRDDPDDGPPAGPSGHDDLPPTEVVRTRERGAADTVALPPDDPDHPRNLGPS